MNDFTPLAPRQECGLTHCFQCNGDTLLLDVESGNIFQADALIAALLPHYANSSLAAAVTALSDSFSQTELREAWTELDQLVQAELLYTQPQPRPSPPASSEGIVKALCLHVAHDCNMRCAYCFADGGDYGMDRSLMSLDTARAAIDFVLQSSGPRKHLEIDFFGGEPLVNWEVVTGAVAYGRKRERETGKVIRFTLTTNALALDNQRIDFINREMANVVLSLDGRPEVHDRLRKTVSGKGSFAQVAPRALALATARGEGEYYVRGTYTAHNLDFMQDVLYLHDMGFEQLSLEPMVSADAPYRLTEQHLPGIRDEYHRLVAECYDRRINGNFINFFHFMLDLDDQPCVHKRMLGCGAGSEYLAVAPDGTLYPCHQFVGDPAYAVGKLPNTALRASLVQTFARDRWMDRPECRRCWARYHCSGGCAAAACKFNGDIQRPYGLGCELFKLHLECALWLAAKERADAAVETDATPA